MSTKQLKITIEANDKTKYVFQNIELEWYFMKLIEEQMFELEGKRLLRLKEVCKIKELVD